MQQDNKTSKSKNRLFTIIKVVVSVLLLTYFLSKYDIFAIISSVKFLPLWFWILLAFITQLQVFINAIRLKVLLPDFKFIDILRVLVINGFYIMVLPGQLVSEGVKVAILGQRYKQYELIGVAVAVDKLVNLVGLLLLGAVGLLLTKSMLSTSLLNVFLFFSVAIVLFLALVQIPVFYNLCLRILKWFSTRFKWFSKFSKIGENLLFSWKKLSGNPVSLMANFSLGLIYQFSAIGVCFLISYLLSIQISFVDWMWIEPAMSIVLLLPLSIGGLGLREGTLVGVLGLIGIFPEQALSISIVLTAQQLIRAAIGGITELFRLFISPMRNKVE